MKKKYAAPAVELMELDNSDIITASSGHAYELYVDGYTGCNETPTGRWFDMIGDSDGSCMKEIT